MLEIFIPRNNVPERRYIISMLFGTFLGLEHSVQADDKSKDYSIRFDKSELIIKDGFFGQHPGDLSYLDLESLPKKVSLTKNDFTPEPNIPMIFGTS